tara:strand:- start:82820 stop:83455 length:636 start_codon:yes stop_codon:yes gene_type:complete
MNIDIYNLVKSFQKNIILNSISLQVNSGNLYGITGPNGSGKSTFLKCIAGLTSIDSGVIRIGGAQVSSTSKETRKSTFLINHEVGMYGSLTASENLQFFGSLYKKASESTHEILFSVGLKNQADKEIRFFSAGMLQRLKLAVLLLLSPEVILLDEPTSGLDESGIQLFNSFIINWKKERKTVIVVTHDRKWLEKHTNKVSYLIDGNWTELK